MAKIKTEVKKKVEVEETKEKKTVKKAKDYNLEVTINDNTFKSSADSLKEALTDIITRPDFPFAPKTRVFIKYGNKDVVKQKVMNTVIARRIFAIMSHKDIVVEIFTNKLTSYLNE